MDPARFDRMARGLGAVAARRGLLAILLGVTGLGMLSERAPARGRSGRSTRTSPRRAGGPRRVSAERKRKKKKKRCTPQCGGRICGFDGCGGSCGTCPGPTGCNGQGQCVGCGAAADCPVFACREASCDAGICRYATSADGTECGAITVCCAGSCTNTGTDPANCGRCGQTCGANQACFLGQCVAACDVCASGCLFATVQAAVDAAAAGGIVTLCPGTYTGAVNVGKDLTLAGLGSDPSDTVLTYVNGIILRVAVGKTVTVRNLSVSGVPISSNSPPIFNQGVLRLEAVQVTDNHPSGAGGGGIDNRAELTLVDCLVRGNSAGQGGGVNNESGAKTTLIRSRVEGNTAASGGGIANIGGTLVLRDASAVTGNTANGVGGQIFGGGIRNSGAAAAISIDATSSVTGNDPDDCADDNGGTGCP